jgi:PAS domain S-box-containing protein
MLENDAVRPSYDQYFNGDGEMASLTRAYDWSNTVLGSPDTWSKNLLTTVSIILRSKFPMFLWWGSELIQFYNDAYRPSMGNNGKHPMALGQHGSECWPEIWPVIKPLIDQVMAGGESTWSEDQLIPIYRNNQLEDVYWTFSYSKVDGEAGTPGGVLVICSETTEKVNSLNQIAKAEEMLRFSIASANAGTWMMNTETGQFKASSRFKELYGLTADQPMTAGDAIGLIDEEYREQVSQALEATLKNNIDFNIEYPVLSRSDQTLRWLRSFGKLYPDADGGLNHFSGLTLEITEEKLNELRKNDFIGIVSHELKTPLTSLTAYIQMLKSKLKLNEDPFTHGALDKAFSQVKKMSTMVNSFLNISRLEKGNIPLDKEKFSLDELIRERIDDIRLAISGYDISFDSCDITVFADREKIGSVITNLLSNAVKYSPKGKIIAVKCSVLDDMAEIEVKDEGMGIKPADVDRLFERFYRVENKNTHNISGFGIGLYLSAEIITRHEGKIWVESKSGIGSTFYFNLPLVPA